MKSFLDSSTIVCASASIALGMCSAYEPVISTWCVSSFCRSIRYGCVATGATRRHGWGALLAGSRTDLLGRGLGVSLWLCMYEIDNVIHCAQGKRRRIGLN